MAETIIYRDLDLAFKMNPINNDVMTKTNVNSVKQALHVLMMTTPGEKKFDPLFGVGINAFLFETPSPAAISLLEKKIKTQIDIYEPRAVFETIVVSYGDEFNSYDKNEIVLTLYFYVRGINTIEPIKLTFERIK